MCVSCCCCCSRVMYVQRLRVCVCARVYTRAGQRIKDCVARSLEWCLRVARLYAWCVSSFLKNIIKLEIPRFERLDLAIFWCIERFFFDFFSFSLLPRRFSSLKIQQQKTHLRAQVMHRKDYRHTEREREREKRER